ncbi:DUF3231 family protein [Candidatus Formimonas warabiya]|uniref:DUF3231 family protein n=1 Tax=Formimonas warabiya TaxID=1761012 RepID=A0A3G1KN51_FORW1|nr:DUF3231 family protein [Candidatus Formimonas warabiya]ATW23889.1 hypothetical protein DCMF_02940 [Candidatus Formimonas warabiya]
MDNSEYSQINPENIFFNAVKHDLRNIMPTSSEISHLWSGYLAESMSITFLKHMVAKAKDRDFHDVLQFALATSSQRVKLMEELFHSIKHPIPNAFGEKDVDVQAQELFSEEFSVKYTRHTTKYILLNYSFAFSDCTRPDFRELFSGFIDTAKEVIARADDVLIAKGLFPKSPLIPVPDQVDYVVEKNYFGSLIGSERPLNVVEINNIFTIMDYKRTMRALKLGFAQVTKSDKVRNHLNRGLKMADKQLQILGSFLEKEGLPGPETMDSQVTDSKESPYSDRLMMVHVTIVLAYIVLAFGRGQTNTSRKDVVLAFSRLMAEVMAYVKDGMDLLIENRWLERVPQAADRQELTH